MFVPYLVSMSCTIRGTTTAGETAPRTAPMTAASIRLIPKTKGANKTKARISKLAGTQDIMIAGRPTFFRSAMFRDRPAFKRMIINAICRSSEEMERMDGESRLSIWGPSTIPVISMPMIRGSLIC